MLSSNLLKRSWVQVQSEKTRVINSSAAFEKRVQQGFHEGIGRPQAEQTDADMNAASAAGDTGAETMEGFQGGLNAETLDALTTDMEAAPAVIKAEPPKPVYSGPTPEELIAQAQEEIEQLRIAAQQEIEQARAQAAEHGREEGRQQGYREGMGKAEAELAEQKRRLDAVYQEQIKNLEPELVKQLTGIYEHIFHVELGEYHNLVMGLLESCMQKIEASSNYIVHVSKEDYPYVSMQKKQLTDAVGNKNAALEVVEDASMRKNECMIEADSGIYDCSLDMQLGALRRELMLLSYEGKE